MPGTINEQLADDDFDSAVLLNGADRSDNCHIPPLFVASHPLLMLPFKHQGDAYLWELFIVKSC
jgi:hypothetical protein